VKLERSLDNLLAAIEAGQGSSIYLLSGDLTVAEAQALRLAQAVARRAGPDTPVQSHRRPAQLSQLFADLETFSLFGDGKVVLVVDSALLADKSAAADLIDEAAGSLAGSAGKKGAKNTATPDELSPAQREGASRLLQALHIFGVDPRGKKPEALLEGLPKWAFQGGAGLRKKSPRGRPAKEVAEIMPGLAELLRLGLEHELHGFAEGDLAKLGEMVERGLPDRHFLILAEASVAEDHPVVAQLAKGGSYVALPRVTSDKGGWQGLGSLAGELQQELGIGISADALAELARRTLRQKGDFGDRGTDPESTARLAGEYRKLASLAKGQGRNRIEVGLVAEAVQDRGEEDVWQILDALGQGKAEEAVRRYRRLIEGADEAVAARLSFFSLLASFCRQLAAVGGMARRERVPGGLRNYNQFKDEWAPKLQKEPPNGGKNPLAGLHPYRLHRAYLLACLLGRDELLELPWRVLETEMRIKGESSEADAAVGALLTRLASRPASRS
jgi:hypothetical protein